MKYLGKLLVTLIVVAVIGFTVGYLLMNSSEKIVIEQSGDIVDTQNLNESGENERVVLELSKEEKLKNIDAQVHAINYNSIYRVSSGDLSEKFVSQSAREFMDYFKVKGIGASINIKQGCIEIIPYSDFIENMVYYYDGDGNLILYESVSTTVGGSSKYYFDKGELIDIVVAYEEEVEPQKEDASDILSRAKIIYEKYSDRKQSNLNENIEGTYTISGENQGINVSGE